MFYAKYLITLLCLFALTGCGDLQDDLFPSSDDKRENVTPGSTGHLPGQVAADFSVKDSLNNDFVLSENLDGGTNPADLVVLYFTMWCPICLSHTDHLYSEIIPQFRGRGTVVYGLVDYVSGSVSATRSSEIANGYANSDFTTLSDVNRKLFDQFEGSMGTVVVIDSDGTILLNEDFRTGTALVDILERELP